jgi:hypothetical protein
VCACACACVRVRAMCDINTRAAAAAAAQLKLFEVLNELEVAPGITVQTGSSEKTAPELDVVDEESMLHPDVRPPERTRGRREAAGEHYDERDVDHVDGSGGGGGGGGGR